MPTEKGRLPLKKVRIHETNSNLYYKNRSKLGLLPKLFLYFFLIASIGLPFWYLNVLNVQAFFLSENNKTVTTQPSPATLVKSVEEEPVEDISLIPANQVQEVITKSKDGVLIENEAGLKCYLDFSGNRQDIQSFISKSPEGWWFPSSCAYSKLRAIQIIRLTDTEFTQLANKINPSNLQNLDGQDTYAIAYTERDESLPYSLEKYIKSLTLPIFQDRYYFNTSSAFETKRIGRYSYYLDGNCQGGGTDPCKLWRADNDTGTIELLKKNVGLTGKDETNELKPGFIVKFATKQDYSYGINLIFLNQQTGVYKLLRINQTEWKVFESLEIPKSDSLYSVYYL